MAMQASALREGELLSEINTTPLIDVMLEQIVIRLNRFWIPCRAEV